MTDAHTGPAPLADRASAHDGIVEDGVVVEAFDGGVKALTLSRDPSGPVEVLDRNRGHVIAATVDGRTVTKPGFFGYGRSRYEVTYDVLRPGERQVDLDAGERVLTDDARFLARSAGLDPDTLDPAQRGDATEEVDDHA